MGRQFQQRWEAKIKNTITNKNKWNQACVFYFAFEKCNFGASRPKPTTEFKRLVAWRQPSLSHRLKNVRLSLPVECRQCWRLQELDGTFRAPKSQPFFFCWTCWSAARKTSQMHKRAECVHSGGGGLTCRCSSSRTRWFCFTGFTGFNGCFRFPVVFFHQLTSSNVQLYSPSLRSTQRWLQHGDSSLNPPGDHWGQKDMLETR